MEPTPVYIELDWTDHDAIERELDEQMGLGPKPPKWKPVGPALTCGHARVTAVRLGEGLMQVTCVCLHSWLEIES